VAPFPPLGGVRMDIIERQTGLIQECKPDLVLVSCVAHVAAGEKLEDVKFAAKIDAAGNATVVPVRAKGVDAASPL